MDRALDAKIKSYGFNSYCWSCVKLLDTLPILYYLCLPSSDRYLVDESFVPDWLKLLAYLYDVCAEFSQGRYVVSVLYQGR